jgi:hypothetical protein
MTCSECPQYEPFDFIQGYCKLSKLPVMDDDECDIDDVDEDD